MKKSDFIPNIQLTEHFNLVEFLYSSTLEGLNNFDMLENQCNIDVCIVNKLYNLCHAVLEPARRHIGKSITINSGYRCKGLNSFVGGVPSSQHKFGEAADITCSDNKALFDYLRNNTDFDQLICYGSPDNPRFIHVSFESIEYNRHQVIFKS